MVQPEVCHLGRCGTTRKWGQVAAAAGVDGALGGTLGERGAAAAHWGRRSAVAHWGRGGQRRCARSGGGWWRARVDGAVGGVQGKGPAGGALGEGPTDDAMWEGIIVAWVGDDEILGG